MFKIFKSLLENIDGIYNCTKCEKCFRTLYPIELYGYKDLAVTFNEMLVLEF